LNFYLCQIFTFKTDKMILKKRKSVFTIGVLCDIMYLVKIGNSAYLRQKNIDKLQISGIFSDFTLLFFTNRISPYDPLLV